MGDKIRAKRITQRANVPTISDKENIKTPQDLLRWMKEDEVEFPIMIKAEAGGSGKGMVRVDSLEELPLAIEKAASEVRKAFGDDTLLVEKFVKRGRHIEVQILADTH